MNRQTKIIGNAKFPGSEFRKKIKNAPSFAPLAPGIGTNAVII